METLLEELIFISAYEQDPLKIEAVWQSARSNKQSKHLNWMIPEFDDLLFLHLKAGDQWDLRNNVSACLDQIQLAYRLGLHSRPSDRSMAHLII